MFKLAALAAIYPKSPCGLTVLRLTLIQECDHFYMVLSQMMREEKNLSETQRKVAQKVIDNLGNCLDYARQIADILIENRLPPALRKEL
ncbi:hypothetical protein AAVH_11623 [Aphelenchoides avenae]|nr:hypothetical protein AAVH_11623 [Aphelenchus avenae]